MIISAGRQGYYEAVHSNCGQLRPINSTIVDLFAAIFLTLSQDCTPEQISINIMAFPVPAELEQSKLRWIFMI
jgi:hypothetical protein